MQCAEALERLPERFNGTLDPALGAELEAHLATCPACREEWAETRLGAAVLDSHLPTDAIVALAWGRAPASLDPDLAQQHLEGCRECADDLAAARESRAREMEIEPLRAVPVLGSWVLPATLAAGLAVAAFGAGLYWGDSRARLDLAATAVPAAASPSRPIAAGSSGGAPDALDSLRETESKLRARLERLTSPQLNLPVLELLPGSAESRQAGPSEPELVIASGDSFAALVLSVPTRPGPVAIELRNAKGVALWKGDGLRPSPLGGYAIGIPSDLLETGRYSIVLSTPGQRAPEETFAFRARRLP